MTFVRAVEVVPERAGDAATYPWSLPDDVRLTRAFLDDPQRFLHHLLDD